MANKLPMPFEKWTTYEGHSGVDFPYKRGTPIRASGNGVVTAISYSDTGGWRVWVDYGEGRIIKYVHMDAREKIVVSVGERVSYEQIIAYVGSLGLSTGPHLHIENGLKAGFDYVWDIVDKNKWVGMDDMGTIDNTEENYQTFARFMQRAFKFDIRENGFGPDWKQGVTLWEKLNAIQRGIGVSVNLNAKEIADSIVDTLPDDLAKQVVDELSTRLK